VLAALAGGTVTVLLFVFLIILELRLKADFDFPAAEVGDCHLDREAQRSMEAAVLKRGFPLLEAG